MAKVIAITTQKGGAGKTTTAAATAAGLSLKGYRTLLIDLDNQRNLTYAAGADHSGATALEVLTGEAAAADAIQHTAAGDIIAASKALAGADALLTDTGKEYRLKEALEPIQALYDYIIVDTPPTLGILTVNALTACNSVVIPSHADFFNLHGVLELAETINPVRKYCNPGLTIAGILLTQYNPRTVFSQELAKTAQQIAQSMGTKVFHATIRNAVAVTEAQNNQQTLYQYAPRAKVTADYTAFIEELLQEG